jgi:hypothetical protein
MSRKKPTLKISDELGSCFHKDGGVTVFSVADFMRLNRLPDDSRLWSVVIEEIREMFPDVRILEDWN